MRFIVVAAVILGSHGGLLATEESRSRCPVEVVSDAEDDVGERLVYQVKEQFKRSASFYYTGQSQDHVRLVINTMDRYKGNIQMMGVSTVYAVIWLFALKDTVTYTAPLYVDNTIGFCGSERVEEAAEGIVARTDYLFALVKWKK